MKNLNLFPSVLIGLVLFTSGLSLYAHENDYEEREDNRNGLSVYQRHISGNNKVLSLYAKNNEAKNVSFKGVVKIPESVKVITIFGRDTKAQAYIVFDEKISCLYETKYDRRFFSYIYKFVKCSDGSRALEDQKVDGKISLFLKDHPKFPSTVYANISILEHYKKGIKLPLEASEGQVLKFSDGLWSAGDILPDGQNAGDILSWDGANWIATKLAGGAGEKGDKGDQGIQGVQGIQGSKGDKGDQGLLGNTGLTGPTGAMGPQGLSGLSGSKGDKGDQGIQGIQGPIGATGATGLTGNAGPTGAMGPQGLSGLSGSKGDKGDQGIQGVQGLTGSKGEQGIQGLKGNTGDAGLVKLIAGAGIVSESGEISGNGGTIAVNVGSSAGQIPVLDANGKLNASVVPDNLKFAYIKDVKSNNTAGGTCDPGLGWEQLRDLNSLTGDTSFIGLNVGAKKFTLVPGTYIIEATAPAYLDGLHKAILVNSDTAEIVIVGSNARSHNVGGGMEPSIINGIITVTANTSYSIKHRCSSVMNTIGFGAPLNFGVEEVYTQIKISKIK